jgi:hypothetical protein
MSDVPRWVDQEMPPRGPCGLCDGSDARHRVLDAIVDRCRAGDDEEDLADDYGLTVPFVERLVKEWQP